MLMKRADHSTGSGARKELGRSQLAQVLRKSRLEPAGGGGLKEEKRKWFQASKGKKTWNLSGRGKGRKLIPKRNRYIEIARYYKNHFSSRLSNFI